MFATTAARRLGRARAPLQLRRRPNPTGLPVAAAMDVERDRQAREVRGAGDPARGGHRQAQGRILLTRPAWARTGLPDQIRHGREPS